MPGKRGCKLISDLLGKLSLPYHESFPLGSSTTMGVGGRAEFLVSPFSLKDLLLIQRYRSEEELPVVLLGGGSNIIFTGEKVEGLVVSTLNLNELRVTRSSGKVRIVCGAGLSLRRLLGVTLSGGVEGLEFSIGIPGTLGGALCGNAGVRGHSISEVIDWVELIEPGGELKKLSRDQIRWGYRHSDLGEGSSIVYRCGMTLKSGDPEVIRHNCLIWWNRRGTQPYDHKSAGCIFKNPVGHSAGRLLDSCGCKGLRKGDALVSEKHANFIVNIGHANYDEVLYLIRECRRRVYERTGIMLELEVKLIGNEAL